MLMTFMFLIMYLLMLGEFNWWMYKLISFSISSSMEMNFSISIILDSTSMIFLLVVSMVSTLIMFYSIDYMKGDKMKDKFFLCMNAFIVSMIILSTSSSMFWVMIGWDGLGISSFFLITYFQNWKSFNSAMTTFISNRIGDLFLISSIIFFMEMKSFSCMMNFSDSMILCSVLVMISAFTKSAQIPFSAWLPLAMAAPTPVSSLVHSSTLITAGVFLLIRFNQSLFNSSTSLMIMMISSMTIILSGTSAMMEFDLKKLIALSTLSHIGFMIMFVSMGEIHSATIHLSMHAIFKSLLFMSAGILIHEKMNNQDMRSIFLSLKTDMKVWITMMISCLSMMGIPFMSGFYSKELMAMKLMEKSGYSLEIIMFLLSVTFTVIYSMRMMMYLMSVNKITPMMMKDSKGMNSMLISTFVGSIMSCIMGGLFSWHILTLESISNISSFMFNMKLIIFITMFIALIFTINKSKIMGKKNFSFFLSSMWMIKSSISLSQEVLFTNSWKNFYYINKSNLEHLVSSMYMYSEKFNKNLPFPPHPLMNMIIKNLSMLVLVNVLIMNLLKWSKEEFFSLWPL
uniref:NADH dehydrogenase subunit 5 n=1 Tax=Falcolipeurus marginalis TaxID=236517 RepID=UPI00211DF52C|nr:NADH dehydrogenase subunit 5 [Falcolipeurus marginalis]UTT72601.1 NADH dehydrogenase subunit 5 [Falcolipeurus marginalis]